MADFPFLKSVSIFHGDTNVSPCYAHAVEEAARLLGRMGISVKTVRTAGGAEYRVQLVPDGAKAAPDVPSCSAAVTDDGYTLSVRPDRIFIAAREAKGVLNGVYDLAERMGYLFLLPGESGEWPPEVGVESVRLTEGEWTVNPRFPHRGVIGGGNGSDYSQEEWLRFFAKLRFNAVSTHCVPEPDGTETVRLVESLGLRLETGGHGLSGLLPREMFETRPELFRMFQPEDFSGKRLGDFNFCVTSPEAKRIIQENYRKKLRQSKGVYAVHTWGDDLPGGGWCLCPSCRAFSSSDQAMLAMRHLAEVIAQEGSSARVPAIAYHDTMFPGQNVPPPPEAFLLFAPRERCYGHALDDPSCPLNQHHLRALEAWMKVFRGIGDAHTFEYYFDQILFRGLYPFLPQVILDDMKVYERSGIESHMSLMVGGSAVAPEYNMLVFARGHWDADLTAESAMEAISARILPNAPAAWQKFFSERQTAFETGLRVCHVPSDAYFDYRWLPEMMHPDGRAMAGRFIRAAEMLEAASKSLLTEVPKSAPDRVRALVEKEAGRAGFEAAELRVMGCQQEGLNGIAQYILEADPGILRQALESLREARRGLDMAIEKARKAGLPEEAYYFDCNRRWIGPEIERKIAVYEKAL